MGFGFVESVYENCLTIEMQKLGILAEFQKPLVVYYEGKEVGHFVADIIVNDVVVVELKSVKQLAKTHEVQLVNYLVASEKQIGLLINFGEKTVEVKRKYRELRQEEK